MEGCDKSDVLTRAVLEYGELKLSPEMMRSLEGDTGKGKGSVKTRSRVKR
jgi:hypothetical protein